MKTDQSQESSIISSTKDPRFGKVQSLEIIYLETPNLQSQSLFDYDEQSPKARKMLLKNNAVLALTKDLKFCFLKDNFDKDENSGAVLQKIKEIYCSFSLFDNYYLMKPANNPIAKQLWIDISSFFANLFPIRKKDIIRLGNKKFIVRQLLVHDQKIPIQFDQEEIQSLNQVYDQNSFPNLSGPNAVTQNKICRLCKLKGQINNPLVVPCKCQSLDKYAHFKCLKQHINSKLKIKTNNFSYTLLWNRFSCQKCNQKIKFIYNIDKKPVKLLYLPRPDPPYIILQHEGLNKNNMKQSFLQIIPMQQTKSLCIGSSSQAQIFLPKQDSVQSGHCQLIYDESSKKFLLTDLNSKFGTLIKIRQSLKIRPHHPHVRIQAGNIVLQMTSKRSQAQEKIPNYDESHRLFQNFQNQQKKEDDFLFI